MKPGPVALDRTVPVWNRFCLVPRTALLAVSLLEPLGDQEGDGP